MIEPVRLGLVGAGAIAQTYVNAIEGCDEARLVGVADSRVEAASAIAERFGCPSYPSYQALAADRERFDAIIVCTPPVTHEEICLHFVALKTHVLCEKPFAISASGARRMLRASRDAGVILTMGSKFRYVDDVKRAKSLVQSGVLGDVILFENAFTSRVDMGSRWNSDPRISGGGVLIDNGSHSVDLMRYFLGPLASLQVVEGRRVQGLPVEDTAVIFARSQKGVIGRIDLSWSVNKELESYLNIYGTEGVISVGWKQSRFRLNTNPEWSKFGNGYEKVQAFRSQIRNFARAVRGVEPLLITTEDAVASVEVIEAAYASLARETWYEIANGTTDSVRPRRKLSRLSVVD